MQTRIKIFGALAACGLAASAFPVLAPAGVSDLKGGAMLECSGLPCVEVTTAAGDHLKMLIDTGNLHSIIDESVAKKLGLEIKPYVGRDGKPRSDIAIAVLSGVNIGTGNLGDLKVLVLSLQPDIRKGSMPDADGLLTYAAFGPRLLRLDYKKRRVEFSDVLTQQAPCPKDCGTLTTPTFGAQGPPIVATTGFKVNGKPLVVQIDTMYTGTMLIYPTSVEKLGLEAEQKSKAMRTFSYTDGGVKMIQGSATAEAFGSQTLAHHPPLYFATPDVHLPDGMFDGTVGHELFVGHVLTFDFYSHHFWVS